MWNYIYAPAEYGPILPVSRAWNFVKFSVNLDWAFASRVGIAAQLDDAWPPAQAKGLAVARWWALSCRPTAAPAGGLRPLSPPRRYVIFDWDNIFASYMSSLDPRSKAIAYSNLIQVVRSKTAKGMIPNYSAGGSKSVDRTEPPIGAKVLALRDPQPLHSNPIPALPDPDPDPNPNPNPNRRQGALPPRSTTVTLESHPYPP